MNSVTPDLTGDNNQRAVSVDKILLVYKNIPTVLIANALCCIPLLLTAWNNGIRTPVIVWLALHYGLLIVRAMHQYSFRPDSATVAATLNYGRVNLLLISMTGAIWGFAGVLFFDPELITLFSFLGLTLVCMISGSMSAISSLPPAYSIFSIFTLGPMIVVALLQGTGFYSLMGSGALFYLCMTIMFSRNLNHAIHDSLTLKYENMSLVENLRIQTETAQKISLDKSRFLAAASHDVRQPLHAITLFTSVLEQQIDTDKQRNSLAGIQRGLSSLSELFDALLDVSRIDANVTPVNKTHFQLDEMVAHVISLFENSAGEKGITLTSANCQYTVHTDQALFEQILTNLVGNAVRYTHQGSVEIYCDAATDSKLTLHIKDTGIGIAEADLEPIFEEFTQLNNPERDRNKGLGLGLTITRRLVNLLQLPLQVSSQPGTGSDFFLEIPLSQKQAALPAAIVSVSNTKQLEGLKVLVVDNEEEIVTGIQLLLESWQCEVQAAHSTVEALDIIQSGSQPDLVIADYRMPGELNGMELIYSLQQYYPGLAGLIVTGDTSPDILLKAQQERFKLLHKPVKPARLHMAMTEVLTTEAQTGMPTIRIANA